MLKDPGIWHFVAPVDAEDAPQAAEVEAVQLLLLFVICRPCFTAIQECTDDKAIFVFTVSLGFSKTCVASRPSVVAAFPVRWLIFIEGQIVTNGGSKIGELVDNVQLIVVDGDDGWSVHVLAHHIGLFQADREAEVFASLRESVHETLEILLSV